MLTIKNIEKIENNFAFSCKVLETSTHYVFYVEPYGKGRKPNEITLSKYKVSELYGSAHPHPNRDSYLLLCDGLYQTWLETNQVKDIWHVSSAIEVLLNNTRF